MPEEVAPASHYRLAFRCTRCKGAGDGHGTKVVVAGRKADPLMAQMHRHGLQCPVCARGMRLDRVEEFTPEAEW